MARPRPPRPQDTQLPPSDQVSDVPVTERPPVELPRGDTNGDGERKPVKVFSYLIQRDTHCQLSIWERQVQMRNGESFVTYDISIRKRYKSNGEWKSSYSFSASETYAVIHGLNQANAWVASMREATEAGCPF